jgi:hypothetical protein
MNKILLFFITAIFLTYWGITIFFNLPDNPIKIIFSKEEQLFQGLLFQQWSFFAPPPKSNNKLYYFFKSKTGDSKILIYEALDSISINKQKHIPFNTTQEIQDYIMSGSISEITTFIYQYTNELKTRYPRGKESAIIEKAINDTWKMRQTIGGVETLIKYGRILAKNKNIDLAKNEMKFMITAKDMIRYKDIDKPVKNLNLPENKLFETPYIN